MVITFFNSPCHDSRNDKSAGVTHGVPPVNVPGEHRVQLAGYAPARSNITFCGMQCNGDRSHRSDTRRFRCSCAGYGRMSTAYNR